MSDTLAPCSISPLCLAGWTTRLRARLWAINSCFFFFFFCVCWFARAWTGVEEAVKPVEERIFHQHAEHQMGEHVPQSRGRRTEAAAARHERREEVEQDRQGREATQMDLVQQPETKGQQI